MELGDGDTHDYTAYVLTTAAGLSTGIGGVLVVLFGIPSNNRVGMMQSFAGGLMITISFTELLAPAIAYTGYLTALISFIIGYAFMLAVSAIIPEQESSVYDKEDGQFWHVGVVTAIGISMHNFPEGMAVFLSSVKAVEYGVMLAVAITLHNIPEGIAVAAPIYKSTHSAARAVWASLFSGLFEPLGALIAGFFLQPYLNDYRLNVLYCIVSGVMVCMSITELIPTSLIHSGQRNTTIAILIGAACCFLLTLAFDH